MHTDVTRNNALTLVSLKYPVSASRSVSVPKASGRAPGLDGVGAIFGLSFIACVMCALTTGIVSVSTSALLKATAFHVYRPAFLSVSETTFHLHLLSSKATYNAGVIVVSLVCRAIWVRSFSCPFFC